MALGEPARQRGADGAHGDMDRPTGQRRQRAVGAEHHVFERSVICHHCDQHLGVARGGGGTVGHDGVELLELVRTGARPIVERERVARLQQVPRHRQAHAAESDESDFHMFKVNEARMKAIRVHRPGGPEALRYEEIERPAPGPGQVLVKIEAAGVNFIDVYQRTGHYKVPLPVTLGQEAAGTVSAVGPGVAEPKVGERVAYASLLGAYAEYAVVPADRVVVLPDGVSTKQGAAVMLQGMTAHYLATSTYAVG